MDSHEFRVLVLGLDGATFDLMLPWMEQGHLPALAGLMRRGTRSPLESTIPPITPCAWSSFMTGVNPGKHGLFDFVEPSPDGRSFRFTNASSRHAQSLWSHLSAKGRRVGIMNVPMTYPPEPVNGYLISGLDTPDELSPYMYPDTLRKELRSAGIKYQIDPRHLGNMRSDRRRQRWLQELCDIERIRTRALKFLGQRHPADFTMIVYSATDQVQHHFWHYMDPTHDKYDAKRAPRFGSAIRNVYVTMDELIASVLSEIDENTIVIIMSDHGFGPVQNVRIRMNQALERSGLLAFSDGGIRHGFVRSLAGAVDRCLRSTLSPSAKRWIASLFPRLRVWFEDLDEAHVDWNQTVAAANEAMRCFPSVFLKRAEGDLRSPAGNLSQEEALKAVEQVMLELRDPETGRPVISQVYRTRDIYSGPLTDKAPDLIPSWWLDGFLLEQSVPGGSAASVVERSKTPVQGGVEFAGSHQLDGVFMMAGGPALRGHSFTGAKIIDIAPTILYLMGLPIPAEMDGRPLLEALDPDFVAGRPPRYDGTSEPGDLAPAHNSVAFTAEEEGMIADRLRSMGYL